MRANLRKTKSAALVVKETVVTTLKSLHVAKIYFSLNITVYV